MRILAIDIGTGTQDILLYDSRLDIENCYQMVLPSPTMMIRQRVQQATQQRIPILLKGVTMGGGPCSWAIEAHAAAGLPTYMTPAAARTLNDDQNIVASLGIQIISEDEARLLPDTVRHIELADFNVSLTEQILAPFGISLNTVDALALAVFDHGAAPPEVSDRKFRFDYFDSRIQAHNRLSAFAYPSNAIPDFLTRMQAVAQSASGFDGPVFIMDTAPASVSGALYDPQVAVKSRKIIANIGNFHSLAFRLGEKGIEGVFEHHTGLLSAEQLERYLRALAASTLTNSEVFLDHGHGALVYDPHPLDLSAQEYDVICTGPLRSMLRDSQLRVYNAVPFGDMMMAGCIGLLAAVADLAPNWHEPIQRSLTGSGNEHASPWDV